MFRSLWKQKKYRKVLLIQAVIILILLGITVFHKNAVITISSDQYKLTGGTYDAASHTCSIDSGAGAQDSFVTTDEITLRPGLYRVVLSYGADTAGDCMIRVNDPDIAYRALQTNGATLYRGKSATSFQMWVLEGTDSLSFAIAYSGNGSLSVGDLQIVETGGLMRSILLVMLLLFLVLDLFLSGLVSAFTPRFFALALLTIISCLPLCGDYIISGGDLIYHLMRIEGIKDGLLSGQFPVRIAPKWLFGYGYASSVFYGEILLYLPALFRMAGFTVQASYKILLFALNLGTVLTSYYCFSGISADKDAGLVAALLYTLSPDRLFSLYVYAAVGRAGSMLFLPFVALGFYRLFTLAETKNDNPWKERIRNGAFLILGFSGLIQTHSLSGMLTAIFAFLLCLLLLPVTLKKEKLLTLFSSAGLTVLLNAWFLVPFLDFVRKGDFIFEHTTQRTIQSEGLAFSQLMGLFIRRGSDITTEYVGVLNNGQPSLGLPLFLSLIVFFALQAGAFPFGTSDKGTQERLPMRRRLFIWAVPLLSMLAMYMSLYIFPWDRIQSAFAGTSLSGIATFIANIQFPKRFLMIATILLAVLFCLNLSALREKVSSRFALIRKWYLITFAALGLICGLYLTEDLLYSSPYFRIYNEEGMGYGYVSGGEYLPVGTELSALNFDGAYAGSDRIILEDYEKDNLEVSVYVNNAGEDSYVEVPLLCYPGYEADNTDHGKLSVALGDYGRVRVLIPAGFSGTVRVKFHTPWTWYVADAASFITLLLLLSLLRRSYPKSEYTIYEEK